jgi:predicted transposase YdaD
LFITNNSKYSFRGLEYHVGKILEVIARSPLNKRTKDFISALFRYILIAGRRENRDRIEQAIKEFRIKEVEEAYMTIADELMERGELRGIRKGKREGKIEEKQQVLVRQLKRKFVLSEEENELILAVVDPDVLNRALDEIITAESKEAVLGLLQ